MLLADSLKSVSAVRAKQEAGKQAKREAIEQIASEQKARFVEYDTHHTKDPFAEHRNAGMGECTMRKPLGMLEAQKP